jgi:hypothetical protein
VWRPGATAAPVKVDMSSAGAVFKGLAISNGASGPRITREAAARIR